MDIDLIKAYKVELGVVSIFATVDVFLLVGATTLLLLHFELFSLSSSPVV